MRKPVILITGANGEIGHGLLTYLGNDEAHNDGHHVVTLDVHPLDERLRSYCLASIVGDILDENLLNRLVSEYEIHAIYHLAALLSTRAEYTPQAAHRVNVDGTINLLHLAAEQARWHGKPVKFLFPSSIAAYGMPDLATKNRVDPVREDEWNMPTTMYGCNKLYCEQVGRYYSYYYRQLAAEREPMSVDFRSLRFPGLISAFTLPSGGTSDYAPEMIHAAVQRKPYACFVGPETRIPFMAMPDAIKALLDLAAAPRERLRKHVYNVTAFSPSAEELRDLILSEIPEAEISFQIDERRAAIIDTWPARADDSAARRDWGWQPEYDLERAFREYLLPNVTEYYRKNST